MIKAVFFDNDGILVDTEPTWIRSNVEAFHAAGFPVTFEWYLDYNMTQGKGLTTFLPAHGFSPEEIQKICTERTERYWEILPTIEPMKGVELVLKNLKTIKGLTLGIVTACGREDFRRIHQGLSLESYFDFCVMNDDTVLSKPNPEPYLLALEKAGVGADEVVVIEDSPRGVKAAKAAGIDKIIAIPTEITERGDFSQAWRVEDNIESVLDLIHNLNQ